MFGEANMGTCFGLHNAWRQQELNLIAHPDHT